MSTRFRLDFTVRDYELDQYGVVNNAVYLNYLEHTRHEFLSSIGIPAPARDGRALALSELKLRFRAPLRSQERFAVTLAVVALRGARVVFDQQIHREPDGELLVQAEGVAVFLDQRGRPMRVGPALRAPFLPYLVSG